MGMKKTVAILLSFVLLTGLSACTGAQTQNTDRLTVWCWDKDFNVYAMKEAEKSYNKKHSEKPVNLDIVEIPWNKLQTELTTLSESKKLDKLPDIFLMQDYAFRKNFKFSPDMFTDITDSGIDFSKFTKSKVSYSDIDGKNYAVPFDNGAVIDLVRIDYLKEAGFSPEDLSNITWDEYIEIGKKVKQKTGKEMMCTPLGDPDLITIIIQSCGDSLFNKDGSINIKDNSILKDAIEIYSKLIKSGILKEVKDWDEYIKSINNGEVVSVINGCWIIGSLQSSKDQSGKWEVVDMPKLYKDDPKSTNYSNNGGSSWVVSKNSKNKQLAIDFLKSTFGSDVDFYNEILSPTGAIATYIPAKDAPEYKKQQKFFNDQRVYEKILDFSSKVPQSDIGVYYYEARNAVSNAANSYLKENKSLQQALDEANDELKFKMEN